MTEARMAADPLSVRCCIVGGGPAGMVLGLLLARAGVDVLVLEKHGDFLRDFRGDTIHPSTLEVMHELGLLDDLLKLPHQPVREIRAAIGEHEIPVADFSHLPTHCRFVALMPQWDFLNFLSERARRYPSFKLRMRAEVTDIVEAGDRVVGVRATTQEGPLEVRADLVIAADGRHSVVRQHAGLTVEAFGAPMDVLWFALTRRPDDPVEPVGRFDSGAIFIMLNRTDQWQCGFVIAKGSIDALRDRGLEAFRASVARLARFASDRVGEIRSWDDVKLLTVQVDRLTRWFRPGLLCIGDSAHAMSPVGGVGINLAIQDAVAAANLLARALVAGPVTVEELARVQRRRELPTRITQRFQVLVQNRVIRRVIGRAGTDGVLQPPLILRLFARWPALRRIPARMLGLGFRPEHVRSPIARVS
jgi:2-polyprenyl-6-methoxyphenol hydroxylase-like FAD-dependent oxidoreductase